MEKRVVQIGSVTLGAGMPAICVPVMGRDLDELRAAAQAAKAAGADLIELRADSLCAMPDAAQARAMVGAVRAQARDMPLLFTLRTTRDGGAGGCDAAAYEALLCGVAEAVDAVDVELSVGDAAFARMAAKIRGAGAAVIGSSHDFGGTPEEEEISGRLTRMARLGAQVCKIAVMPQSRMDVITLMRAALCSDEALSAPIIAIAMGPKGVLTRVGGEAFGSCLTFGTAGAASAPGQMDAAALRRMMDVLHG